MFKYMFENDKNLKQDEKPVKISRSRAYQNILEWLYTQDGQYPDKNNWREDLIEMIKWNLKHLE